MLPHGRRVQTCCARFEIARTAQVGWTCGIHRSQKAQSRKSHTSRLRPTTALTSGSASRTIDRWTQFDTQHGTLALVALQLEFGQVDLAEVRHHDHVSVPAQFRASGLYVLYQGTQYDALRFRKVIAGEPVIPLPEKFRYVRFRFSP